jgi:hypothetical protein
LGIHPLNLYTLGCFVDPCDIPRRFLAFCRQFAIL